MTIREQIHEQLYGNDDLQDRLSPVNRLIVVVIVLSVIWAVLQTEPAFTDMLPSAMAYVEFAFGAFFLLEYVLRIWVITLGDRYRGWRGRLRYMVSPFALVDLLVLVSFLAPLLVGTDAFILRVLRILRIVALVKLGRFSAAMRNIGHALAERRQELLVSLCLAGVVLLISSTLMHLVEGRAQPEAFGSIPRAFWWSIVTLTTVGYGDVYPLTPLGRICAAVTAVTAVGLIAIPAGILAGAFTNVFKDNREQDRR